MFEQIRTKTFQVQEPNQCQAHVSLFSLLGWRLNEKVPLALQKTSLALGQVCFESISAYPNVASDQHCDV